MTGHEMAQWLDGTAWSTALHESLYAYPLIESTHVLTVMLFAGTILMLDLRLLGLSFTRLPVTEMTTRLLPWTVAGFVVLVSTGLLLFYAIPVRTYHSLWFRVKIALIVISGVNIWIFHRRVSRDRGAWDRRALPPLGARINAAVSIATWSGVIVMGRMIAYNWFDCDRPQPEWVVNLAGCVIDFSAPP